MKHPSNRELFEHWNKQRGNRSAPERNEIEPSAIRQVLGDTFVIAVNAMAQHPFRLAGTRLCALFGRELKAESFVKLWDGGSQTAIRELVAVVSDEKVGVVASATGSTADDSLRPIALEIVLLPLSYGSESEARLLGGLAPMEAPYWLGARSIGPLTLGMFRHIGSSVDLNVPPRVMAASGRLRHGLTVYDGGRAKPQ